MEIAAAVLARRARRPTPEPVEAALADGDYAELARLHRREGDPHLRARHADHRPTQGGRRVRQHLERRRLLRGGHRAGRDGLGHARAATAARRLSARRSRPGQPDLPRPRSAIKTWVRSWVPSGEIIGMVIRHGEAFTISDHLTVWENGRRRVPADRALRLLPRRRGDRLDARAGDASAASMQPRQRILNDEIIVGPRRAGRAADGPRVQVLVDRQPAVESRRPAPSSRTRTPPRCRSPRRSWARCCG